MAIEILGNCSVDSAGNLHTKRKASYVFYANTTAGGQTKASAGRIKGIFVSAAADTPTIKIWDYPEGAGTTVLIETFTPSANTMYNFGSDVEATTGIYVALGGSVDCTVFYE